MTDNLYIDGTDAFSEYGLSVAEDAFGDLISFPGFKTIETVDYPEMDGIEADLSSPVLDTRTLSIKFVLTGDQYRFCKFIEDISDVAYHTFNFKSIGRTYRLRLVSHPDADLAFGVGSITLKFADDYPLDSYSYVAPLSTAGSSSGRYALDDNDFSEYGISVLEGSISEIKKAPDTKSNLTQNISNLSGALYDGESVYFKSKDVKLSCLMRATTLAELWRNWDALLYDLSTPGIKSLYCDATMESYECYYKACAASSLITGNGRYWILFDLTLVFTSFRLSADEFLLETENGHLFITENDNKAFNIYEYDSD